MADQQFFDARDLGWQIIEQDIRDGTKRTLLHAGLWRARVDVRASATLSPVNADRDARRSSIHDL